MVPIDAYGASDFRSIEADNTSAFNCRYVDGTTRWSEHAYGRAVDLNPIENPYVSGGRTSHRASIPYVDRTPCRKGMACPGNSVVKAFAAVGGGGAATGPGTRTTSTSLPAAARAARPDDVQAGGRVRTGDIQLGRLALYQLSYARVRLA